MLINVFDVFVLRSWGVGFNAAPCARARRELLLGKERAHHVRGRDDGDGDRERWQALLGGWRRRGIGLRHNRGPALRRTVGVELLRQLHGVVDALQVVADLLSNGRRRMSIKRPSGSGSRRARQRGTYGSYRVRAARSHLTRGGGGSTEPSVWPRTTRDANH